MDDSETVLNIELEVVVPKDIDHASGTGGPLGLLLFNKVICGIRNLMQENGATGENASNAILNAQIVSFAYTMATVIAAMEGSSMLPDDLIPKVAPILKDIMQLTGEVIERHAKRALFSIRDRTKKEGDPSGP
jgi:hypothetical protein